MGTTDNDDLLVQADADLLMREAALHEALAARDEQLREALAARDERMRAEGRRQADAAIVWDTSCVLCAGRLTDERGYWEQGYLQAAVDIAREIEAAGERAGGVAAAAGFDEAARIALKHAARSAEDDTV